MCSLQCAPMRDGALLLDHLEIALQPVLHVGRREVARVDQVGLDEGGRLAGALFHFAQDQQLAGREAVAALDRVDQQAVGLVLVDVLADHVDARRQVQVGVATQAVVGQRLQRMLGVVAEAEVVQAADLGVGRRHHHRALVVEHLPELAEARPVGRAFDDQPVFLLAHLALGRDRALAQAHALLDLLAQHAVVRGGLGRAAEGGEDRADVVHRAEVAVDRRGPVLGRLQHLDQVLLGLGRLAHVLAQPVDVELDARDALERRDHRLLQLLDHVLAHVRLDVAFALVGHVQHHASRSRTCGGSARTTS